MWAEIEMRGGRPRKTSVRSLAAPGARTPVLANLAARPDGSLLATYRSGRSPEGWASLSAPLVDGSFFWEDEETLPVAAPVDAATLAVDRRGAAHLVLLETYGFRLLYLTQPSGGSWSAPETAAEGETAHDVDLPVLSVERWSRLIYLFFEGRRPDGAPSIRFAIRDPSTGWEGPYEVSSPQDVPEGASFPTTTSQTAGQPFVLWTTQEEEPAVQIARVTAP